MKSSLNLASLGMLFVLAAASPAIPAGVADSGLPEVKPADLAKLSPADFADEDLDLPYYLFQARGENRSCRTHRTYFRSRGRVMRACAISPVA